MKINKSPIGLLPVLLVFGLSGCHLTDKKGGNDMVVSTLLYIHNPDAKDFQPQWSHKNEVVINVIGEPDNMHPTNGNTSDRSFLNSFTQKYLMRTNLRTNACDPDLAVGQPEESADHLSYTYTLRPEARWDDGTPITAADVVFSMKANACPLTNNPQAKPYLKNLIGMETLSDSKIVFKMRQVYIQNKVFLTDYCIMERKIYDPNDVLSHYSLEQFADKLFDANKHDDLKAWAATFNDDKYGHDITQLHGAGPYQWASWDPGQSMVLVKKQNWWGAKSDKEWEHAYPDKLIFKINKDVNAQKLDLKAQAVDVNPFLSTKALLEMQADSVFNVNYHSQFISTFNYTFACMNMKPDGIKHKMIFTDKAVRKAMALLAPVDDIVNVLSKGKAQRMVGPVQQLKQREFNEQLTPIPLDMEAAKKLLTDAGWEDKDADGVREKMINGQKTNLEFEIMIYNSSPDWKEMAMLMKESFYKAGVKTEVNMMDASVAIDKAKHHDFDMMLGSWAGNSTSTDFAQIWGTDSWKNNGSNFGGFGNAETDALIDSTRYCANESRRIEFVKQFQQIVYNEQPYIFLTASIRRMVMHRRFGNADMFVERPQFYPNNFRLLDGSVPAL